MAKLNWYGIIEFLWLLGALALVSFEGWFVHTVSAYTKLNRAAVAVDAILTIGFYVATIEVRRTKKPQTWRQRIAVDQLLLTLKLTIPIFYAVDLLGETKAARYNGSTTMLLLGTGMLRLGLMRFWSVHGDLFDIPADGRVVGLMTPNTNDQFGYTDPSTGGQRSDTYLKIVTEFEGRETVDGRIYVVPSHALYAITSGVFLTGGVMMIAAGLAYQRSDLSANWYFFVFYLLAMLIYGGGFWPYDQWQRRRRLSRSMQILEPTLVYILPMVGIWVNAAIMILAEDSTAEWISYSPLIIPASIVPLLLMLLVKQLQAMCEAHCGPTVAKGCCRVWFNSFLKSTDADGVADTAVVPKRPLRP